MSTRIVPPSRAKDDRRTDQHHDQTQHHPMEDSHTPLDSRSDIQASILAREESILPNKGYKGLKRERSEPRQAGATAVG